MEYVSLLIRAAVVALTSQCDMHCFILSFLIHTASSSMPYAMLERFSVLRIILTIFDLLIVRISGIPSLGCPRGRLVVSSASVRCSESGRRAVGEKRQLEQQETIETDSHCKFPTPLCIPRSWLKLGWPDIRYLHEPLINLLYMASEASTYIDP